MKATKEHRIEITDDECLAILHQFNRLDVLFGPGYAAIVWKKGEEPPPELLFVGKMRGVPYPLPPDPCESEAKRGE